MWTGLVSTDAEIFEELARCHSFIIDSLDEVLIVRSEDFGDQRLELSLEIVFDV